jgi:hypothetical protein
MNIVHVGSARGLVRQLGLSGGRGQRVGSASRLAMKPPAVIAAAARRVSSRCLESQPLLSSRCSRPHRPPRHGCACRPTRGRSEGWMSPCGSRAE